MSSSRRELLKRGLLMVGGALGIGGLAGAGREMATGPRGGRALTLRGRNLRLSSQTRRRGELPEPGDRMLVTGELLSPSGRRAIGTFYATSFGVESSGRVGILAPASLELHTFVLPEGTIVGSGTASRSLDAADSFAIVGGTGRYAGAGGSYTAVQRHLDLGGDGIAEFAMTFTTQEAHDGR